jgi:hypothetical protein
MYAGVLAWSSWFTINARSLIERRGGRCRQEVGPVDTVAVTEGGMVNLIELLLLGAAVVIVAGTVSVVLLRRHRRKGTAIAKDDARRREADEWVVWGPKEWPRIVVRPHGRLRDLRSPHRPLEVVTTPSPSPWAPPSAS